MAIDINSVKVAHLTHHTAGETLLIYSFDTSMSPNNDQIWGSLLTYLKAATHYLALGTLSRIFTGYLQQSAAVELPVRSEHVDTVAG